MMCNMVSLITRSLLVLLVVASLASARPQHFGDSSQGSSAEDLAGLLEDPVALAYLRKDVERFLDAAGSSDYEWDTMGMPSKRQTNRLKCYFNPALGEQESDGSLGSPGFNDLQLEILAHRMAEYNRDLPAGWERMIRSPEMKRQSRFRQCYFNPVSCFKK